VCVSLIRGGNDLVTDHLSSWRLTVRTEGVISSLYIGKKLNA